MAVIAFFSRHNFVILTGLTRNIGIMGVNESLPQNHFGCDRLTINSIHTKCVFFLNKSDSMNIVPGVNYNKLLRTTLLYNGLVCFSLN